MAGIFPGGEIMGEGSRDLVETAAFFADGKGHTLNLSAGGAQGQGDLFDGAAVLEHLEQGLLFGGQALAEIAWTRFGRGRIRTVDGSRRDM